MECVFGEINPKVVMGLACVACDKDRNGKRCVSVSAGTNLDTILYVGESIQGGGGCKILAQYTLIYKVSYAECSFISYQEPFVLVLISEYQIRIVEHS